MEPRNIELLSISDLCKRWIYTKAGIHKLTKSKDFPAPCAIVNCGKTKIFDENSIVEFESTRPWLFDQAQKEQRQKLFGWLQLAKEESPERREDILKKLFGDNSKGWKSP
jgi:hypothetical protein